GATRSSSRTATRAASGTVSVAARRNRGAADMGAQPTSRRSVCAGIGKGNRPSGLYPSAPSGHRLPDTSLRKAPRMKDALDVHRSLLAREVPHEVVRLPRPAWSADDIPEVLGLPPERCVTVRL